MNIIIIIINKNGLSRGQSIKFQPCPFSLFQSSSDPLCHDVNHINFFETTHQIFLLSLNQHH